MARRRFPNYFQDAALDLGFRPRAGDVLPPLTPHQAAQLEQRLIETRADGANSAPAGWRDGIPLLTDGEPRVAFELDDVIGDLAEVEPHAERLTIEVLRGNSPDI